MVCPAVWGVGPEPREESEDASARATAIHRGYGGRLGKSPIRRLSRSMPFSNTRSRTYNDLLYHTLQSNSTKMFAMCDPDELFDNVRGNVPVVL